MERLEYPDYGSLYECTKCTETTTLVEDSAGERRKRLISFLEEHLAKCH